MLLVLHLLVKDFGATFFMDILLGSCTACCSFLFGVGGEGLLLIGQAHSVRAIRQVPQAVAAGRLFMHLIIWGLGVFVHVSFPGLIGFFSLRFLFAWAAFLSG